MASPSSSPTVGLLLALAAAAGNNIGKGMQKAATRQLPPLNLTRKEAVWAYLSNPTWVCGLLLDVAGGAAMLAALAAAPVSLVQPVAAFGLVLLAAFSHFVLQERLNSSQWRGAAIAAIGIIGMGISSSSSSNRNSNRGSTPAAMQAATAVAADQPSPSRILTCFILLLLLLAAEVWWRQQREAAAAAMRKRAGAAAGVGGAAVAEAAAAADAAACGFEAGCCFGFSAAAARTGFQLSQTLGVMFAPLGICVSLGLTSSGFVLQTRGFKHGSAFVVCTAAAAASIVAGVLVGLVALAEPLPPTCHMRLLLLASWAAVLLGVTNMAAAEQHNAIWTLNIFGSNSSSSSSRHTAVSPTHAASSSKSSGYVTALSDFAAGVMRSVLLLLPRDLRRRVLPHKTMQWLGRSGSFSGSSSSSSSTANNSGSSSRRWFSRLLGGDGSSSSSGLGPGLPVSRSSPDFGDVLAPMGGARRPANLAAS